MTVSNLLQEARALIERGWCQGELQIKERYCVIGAIETAGETAGEKYFGETVMTAQKVLWVHSGGGGSLAAWNDTAGRTREEVLALFDRALTEVTK